MDDVTVKFPLRPTLLILSGAPGHETRSLGEKMAQAYAGDGRRLTEKFSRKKWDIPVLDMDDRTVAEQAWMGLETSNMAVIAGYTGSNTDNARLSKIIQAGNPILTLINIGHNEILKDADLSLFHKSLTILPQGLKEQAAMTHLTLRTARTENAWTEHGQPASPDRTEGTGGKRRLN